MNVEKEFTKDKECKHSVRYNCKLESGQAFSIYIPKDLIGAEPYPETVKVKITDK